MSAYEFYLNGTVIAQPKEWEGFEQEIVRDYKKRFLRIAYPGTFTLTNASGYLRLRELFEADICSIVSFEAYEVCGNIRYQLAKGSIILSDCKWYLERCTVEVELQDEAIGARLDNNVRIPVSPQAPKSKNGVDIEPCQLLNIDVFDPTDPVADYLTPSRAMFDWLDAMQHCIRYMTDSNIEVVSEWYELLPLDQKIAIVNGYQLRTGDTAEDSIRLTYDFNALWLEIALRYNLWIAVRRDNTGNSYLAIEPEGDMFSGTQAFELLNQYGLIQSIDSEKMYSAIEVGDDDGLPNLDLTYSLPFLVLQGFSKERFHFGGVCNMDEVLELTGKWFADTNTIERVVVIEPTSEDYDKDTFIIQYNSYLGSATKGDYLQPGTNPYLYNQQMLNINILNRYSLPSDVGSYYNSQDSGFLASGYGPFNGQQVNQPSTIGASFEYPLTGLIAVLYDDDSTPPNNNVGGAWDIPTQRYTAPSQGYYEFLSTLQWTLSFTGVPIACAMVAEYNRYDSGNVLIDTQRPPSIYYSVPGTYTTNAPQGFVMNSGDYVTITWIRRLIRIVGFFAGRAEMNAQQHTLQTTFIAAGGGLLTSVDPQEARIVTYEFDRIIPVSQWQQLVNDPRLGIGVSHTDGNSKPCHILKAKRDSVKGKTSFTLITERRNA
jgi:hypothetical protein